MQNDLLRLMKAHRDELDRWIESPSTVRKMELLQAVASGQHGANGCVGDDGNALYDTVSEALDDLISMLFRGSWNGEEIPVEFWDTDFGQLVQRVSMWLECDELITLSEAAMILRGSCEDRDLIAVNGYIKRGRLNEFTDPDEPNPQRARRVRKSEVEAIRSG